MISKRGACIPAPLSFSIPSFVPHLAALSQAWTNGACVIHAKMQGSLRFPAFLRVWISFVCVFYRHLLEYFQMPMASASFISSSLKSGCAMLIRSSALSQVDLPLSSTQPNSVTMQSVAILGVVTMEPFDSTGEIKLSSLPSLPILVDGVHKKLCPPSD